MRKILTLLTLAVLLSACAPALLAPRTTAVDVTPLVIYARSGGIAAQTTTWILYSDGRLTDGKREFKVPTALASALIDDLFKAGLTDLAMVTPQPPRCADCITATLTLRKDGKIYVLSAVLEDQNTRAEIRAIFARMEQFIQKATKP